MPDMPVCLTAKTPGPVPFNRISEFPPKGKGNPVIRKPIIKKKQLRPGTGNSPFPVEYRPNILPSL
jgi:hypothetical protein